MLEANDAKAVKAQYHRNELERLPLLKLFARAKHGKPKRLPLRDFKKLLDALKTGNITAAQKTKYFDLVDFNGNVIDGDKLEKDAAALEEKVRRDVGSDNTRVQPPPLYKINPKLPEKVGKWIDKWFPIGP